VTVTPDTKNKASKVKKYLKGFEIWVGATAGDKAVKCGGPFAWSVIKRGPVTAQCAAAPTCVCRSCHAAHHTRSIPFEWWCAALLAKVPPPPPPWPHALRHSYVTVVLPGRKKTLGFGEIELH